MTTQQSKPLPTSPPPTNPQLKDQLSACEKIITGYEGLTKAGVILPAHEWNLYKHYQQRAKMLTAMLRDEGRSEKR